MMRFPTFSSTLAAFSALVAAGCGGVGRPGANRGSSAAPPPVAVPTDDGRMVMPGRYADPFVKLQRGPGPTFVEIQEVRAHDDGRVFFCSGVKGLNVVDASNPASLLTVARLQSSKGSSEFPRCQHLAWDGNTLYMVSRGDEIQPQPFIAIFDINAVRPVEVGVFTLPGRTFEGIAAAGGMVYAAMHADGLAILQRRGDRLALRSVAQGLKNAWGVALAGSVAVVADGAGGLVTVDVSNPDGPRVRGRVDIDGAAQAVEVKEGVAFVALGPSGLLLADVSNPDAPAVLARAPTGGTAVQVAVSGRHAFVANWSDARVFDVSDPKRPVLVATERIVTGAFSRVLGIGARGDFAFLGEWTGLYSYELHPNRKAPDLVLSENALEFGRVAKGKTRARVIIAENGGTAPLVSWSLVTSGEGFSVDRSSFVPWLSG